MRAVTWQGAHDMRVNFQKKEEGMVKVVFRP
jgi:hypothetical protein